MNTILQTPPDPRPLHPCHGHPLVLEMRPRLHNLRALRCSTTSRCWPRWHPPHWQGGQRLQSQSPQLGQAHRCPAAPTFSVERCEASDWGHSPTQSRHPLACEDEGWLSSRVALSHRAPMRRATRAQTSHTPGHEYPECLGPPLCTLVSVQYVGAYAYCNRLNVSHKIHGGALSPSTCGCDLTWKHISGTSLPHGHRDGP